MESTVSIPLSRGLVAIIDADDAESVTALSWFATTPAPGAQGATVTYARSSRKIDGRQVMMHALLTGWARVDHINGDGLDNRRSNLRPATRSQNGANAKRRRDSTTGFKGVSRTSNGRFQASVTRDGRRLWLGRYLTPEEAARAYDSAALELFGEFARTNFNQEEE